MSRKPDYNLAAAELAALNLAEIQAGYAETPIRHDFRVYETALLAGYIADELAASKEGGDCVRNLQNLQELFTRSRPVHEWDAFLEAHADQADELDIIADALAKAEGNPQGARNFFHRNCKVVAVLFHYGIMDVMSMMSLRCNAPATDTLRSDTVEWMTEAAEIKARQRYFDDAARADEAEIQ
jgi:hypothetical protein